jgi:hypothetical protein
MRTNCSLLQPVCARLAQLLVTPASTSDSPSDQDTWQYTSADSKAVQFGKVRQYRKARQGSTNCGPWGCYKQGCCVTVCGLVQGKPKACRMPVCAACAAALSQFDGLPATSDSPRQEIWNLKLHCQLSRPCAHANCSHAQRQHVSCATDCKHNYFGLHQSTSR